MRKLKTHQGGVALLEAMIGILIFSLGVLALVAMQAVSTSNVSNARYRSEAAFLANEILAQAWLEGGANNTTVATFYKYPGGGPAVNNWVAKIQGTAPYPGPALLPQSDIYPPTITQSAIPGVAKGLQLTVTVRWKAPDALTPSNHVAIGFVGEPTD